MSSDGKVVKGFVALLIERARAVFEQLGCAHTETVYRNALYLELASLRHLHVQAEFPVNINYRVEYNGASYSYCVGTGYVDLLVHKRDSESDDDVVSIPIELKHQKTTVKNDECAEQLLKYLNTDSLASSPYGVLVFFPTSAEKSVEVFVVWRGGGVSKHSS